jgi:hypothetical protein
MTPVKKPRTRTLRRLLVVVLGVALLGTTGTACDPPKPPRPKAEKVAVFSGVGAWWDTFDWSPTTSAGPKLDLPDVDRLADRGVQVLYIQPSRYTSPTWTVDEAKFKSIVDRAHARGLRVVAWFVPTFVDLKADMLHLSDPLRFGVDGIGMDIEITMEKNMEKRNNALVFLSYFFHAVKPDVPFAAIVLPPVVTEIMNLNYWPNFPYQKLKDLYDVWMPMGYWTNRKADSEWRNAERYTNENIDRIRAGLGDPNAPVHPIGGIGDLTTAEDMAGFIRSAQSRGAIGASIYDDRTSNDAQYAALQPMRR